MLMGIYTEIKSMHFQLRICIHSLSFSADKQTAVSGNVKFNNIFRFSNGFDAQLTAIYLAPDIIPQGKNEIEIFNRCGHEKSVQNGKGEIF